MTYTNPINPKMQVTLNAYTRRRKRIARDLKNHYEFRSPEFFTQVEHVVSTFYINLGYTQEQCAQMKRDMILAMKDKHLAKL